LRTLELNTNINMYNNKPVIREFLAILVTQGLTLVSVDNGDYEDTPVSNIDEAVELIDATDESSIYVKNPDGRKLWVFVTLYNDPCELVSDYTCDPLLDEACDRFFDEWEGKKWPKLKED